MCFKVVFDKTIIGRLPQFTHLMKENYPRGDISAFHFPLLPLIISESPPVSVTAQWGLVPSWVKDFEKAKKIRAGTVNARSESVHEKASFSYSWPHKRCILPVSGFYEPHEIKERGEKILKENWKIEREDKSLFFLGGIFEQTPDFLLKEEPPERDLFGERPVPRVFYEKTFSLLTMEATGLMARIHNGKMRMPLIMTEEKALEWIHLKGGGPSYLFDPQWQMNQNELRGFKVD